MADVQKLRKKVQDVTGVDLSDSKIKTLGFTIYDAETSPLLGNPKFQQCTFEQPNVVRNIPIELVVAPLDFKLTPNNIIKTFKKQLNPTEQALAIQSATKVQLGSNVGISFHIVEDFFGKLDFIKESHISRSIEIWSYLGNDRLNQFIFYAEKTYQFAEKDRNDKEKNKIQKAVENAMKGMIGSS